MIISEKILEKYCFWLSCSRDSVSLGDLYDCSFYVADSSKEREREIEKTKDPQADYTYRTDLFFTTQHTKIMKMNDVS